MMNAFVYNLRRRPDAKPDASLRRIACDTGTYVQN